MKRACSVGAPGGARISSDFGCSPPRSGQGRDEERKAREASDLGPGLFACDADEVKPRKN